MSFSEAGADFVRQHALRAISSNRAPGMHFPGYFLRFECQHYAREGVTFAVEPGPHCADGDGVVHRGALLFAAYMTLAAANRVFLDPNSNSQ